MFGPPPLVPGESEDYFMTLFADFVRCLRAEGRVELMWAWDLTVLVFEGRRLRQQKIEFMRNNAYQGLQSLLVARAPCGRGNWPKVGARRAGPDHLIVGAGLRKPRNLPDCPPTGRRRGRGGEGRCIRFNGRLACGPMRASDRGGQTNVSARNL